MGLGCCSSFAKYILFAFNFLFWVVGSVLLGVGVWVLVDTEAAELFHVATEATSDTLLRGSAITLIIAGAFVFFVAFFGCFGACKESACMLTTYAVIVGIILGIQLLAGILGAVFKDKIIAELNTSMNTTVYEKYGQVGFNETSDSWDYMQRLFGCCGALEGPTEWKDSRWYADQGENSTHVVPVTCCTLTNPDKFDEAAVPVNETLCYLAVTNSSAVTDVNDYVHTQACEPRLEAWVVDHASILIGIAFGLAVVQLMGIIFACCVAKGVRQQYEYV